MPGDVSRNGGERERDARVLRDHPATGRNHSHVGAARSEDGDPPGYVLFNNIPRVHDVRRFRELGLDAGMVTG